VGEISGETDWGGVLANVDAVIHLAGRVHVMREKATDPLAEFRRVNVAGTLNLARQSAAEVQRFVFISSVKVHGERNAPGHSVTENDTPRPEDAYAISKWEAEQELVYLAGETGMEWVIIRPPLVYGPGVKGNFARLLRLVRNGVPLPLGAVRHNLRSLVAVDNLVDLIMLSISNPSAANQVFLASDGNDLSTAELITRMSQVFGKKPRLIPVPERLLRLGASLLGEKATIERLCDSLQVDISKARNLLGWQPPVTVDEGLRRTVEPLV